MFGETKADDVEAVLRNWDRIKKAEKTEELDSILGGLPTGAASLLRAYQVSKRAARTGFEWPDVDSVFDKLDEEVAELQEALARGDESDIESEVGDVLFTVVNLARWAKVEPRKRCGKWLTASRLDSRQWKQGRRSR